MSKMVENGTKKIDLFPNLEEGDGARPIKSHNCVLLSICTVLWYIIIIFDDVYCKTDDLQTTIHTLPFERDRVSARLKVVPF